MDRAKPVLCDGCQACAKVCASEAILGEKKKVHTIDNAKCIRCGACPRWSQSVEWKFSLKYIRRDDIAALTPEASRISGIPHVTDVDRADVDAILGDAEREDLEAILAAR